MYLYGCAASLVLSFAVVGYLRGRPTSGHVVPTRDLLPPARAGRSQRGTGCCAIGRAGALACLLLTMTSGLVGSSDPRANINYTLFWIAFLLGLTYATALLGDLYRARQPLADDRRSGRRARARLSKADCRIRRGLGTCRPSRSTSRLIWMELFIAAAAIHPVADGSRVHRARRSRAPFSSASRHGSRTASSSACSSVSWA